jgi:hypothetical protein
MTRWARRAVPANRQKSIGEAEALFLTNASQPLAKGNRDRACHALASQLCQFLCDQVSLAVFDIQSHLSTFHRCDFVGHLVGLLAALCGSGGATIIPLRPHAGER